jgi:uncharacterized sporulation protein YeaH/YhbH (DUF444 family)
MLQKGQTIGKGKQEPGQGEPNKPGKESGEEYYDVEIGLDELAQYLFADLNLPDLMKKSLGNTTTVKLKRSGYRPDGILPRLDRKKSAIARIKRMKAAGFNQDEAEEGETFPFHEDDLKYRHYKMKDEPCTNAVVFFVMDVSGSMTQNKKFLARSFCFLMYQFIRSKYESIEVVFVTHDATAQEVNEEAFFTLGTYGGTVASSGLEKVNEIIESRYHPNSWNIYCIHLSDGDNVPEDNAAYMDEYEKIIKVSQLFGYCELEPHKSFDYRDVKISTVLLPRIGGKTRSVTIRDKEDVWSSFKEMLGAVSKVDA